jgi:hypothetical protein
MTQYNNQHKTMFQYNSQQNDGLINGHSLNTMTPYNNQQEDHVSSAAECTNKKKKKCSGWQTAEPSRIEWPFAVHHPSTSSS